MSLGPKVPRPASHLAAVAPYPLASLQAPSGGMPLVSLAQNESACPASPAALAAAAEAIGNSTLYPDPNWTELRAAIAAVHDLDPAQILCGAGSMELIAAIAHCFLTQGDQALTTKYGYLFFRTATLLTGSDLDLALERDLTVDPAAILAALTSRTRAVFVANPGNPTGTLVSREAIVALREALPPDVLLVIDEAYGEFVAEGGAGVFDLPVLGNTIVLRTFSKAYGLAGLRAAWGLFPAGLVPEVRKVMLPNNLTTPTQAAATAAMRDQAAMHSSVAIIADRRDRFAARVRLAGLHVPRSHTNFVLLCFPTVAHAAHADSTLRAGGIAMRGMSSYGLPQCLRATIGAETDMDRAAAILESVMREHAAR